MGATPKPVHAPAVDITIVADTKGGATVSIAGGDTKPLTKLAKPNDPVEIQKYNDEVALINAEYTQMKTLIMTNQPYKLLFDLQQTMKKIKDSCEKYKNNKLSSFGGSSMETKLAALKQLIVTAKSQAENVTGDSQTASRAVLNLLEDAIPTAAKDGEKIQAFAKPTTPIPADAKTIQDALIVIEADMAIAMKTASAAASGMTIKSAAIKAVELAITTAAAADAAAKAAAAAAAAAAPADAKAAAAAAAAADAAAKTASTAASAAVNKWADSVGPADAKADAAKAAAKAADAAAAKAADAAAAANPAVWTDVAKLWEEVKQQISAIKGGKRRRNTSKRARKGKHGTRRHYY